MLDHSRLLSSRRHKIFTEDMESRRLEAENGGLDWPSIILSLEHCMRRYSLEVSDLSAHIAIDIRATMHEQPKKSHNRKVLTVRLFFDKGKIYNYRFFMKSCNYKGISLAESYTVYMNDSLKEELQRRHFEKIIRINSHNTARETMRDVEWR